MKRICARCCKEKPLIEFYKRLNRKNSFSSYCLTCHNEITKTWRKNNPEKSYKINRICNQKRKAYHREWQKQWRKNNPEKAHAIAKKSNQRPEYKQKRYEYNKKWTNEHKDRSRTTDRNKRRRYRLRISVRLSDRISGGIWDAIHKNKAGRHWETLVGFTLADLKKHIEAQFVGGMSWDAFMQGEIHIDHKTPKSKFKYEKPEDAEFRACWCLSNLQPLWAHDNLTKHTKTMSEWQQSKTA